MASVPRSYISPPFDPGFLYDPEYEEEERTAFRTYFCDICGWTVFESCLFHCTVCEDFDICERCESHRSAHGHDFVRWREPMKVGSWRWIVDNETRRWVSLLDQCGCSDPQYVSVAGLSGEELGDTRPNGRYVRQYRDTWDIIYPWEKPASDAVLKSVINDKIKRTSELPHNLDFGPASLFSIAILLDVPGDERPHIAVSLT